MKTTEPVEEKDFYWENEFLVFTRHYHLNRGRCCGSGCRHCPYEPRWTRDATTVALEKNESASNQ
jgi:hypothetical protein